MIVWAGILGALIGWISSELETYGLFIGGLFGLSIGWLLRRSVRAEIELATQKMQDQLDAMTANARAAAAGTADPRPRAAQPVDRPAATVVRRAPEPEPASQPPSESQSAPERAPAVVTRVAPTTYSEPPPTPARIPAPMPARSPATPDMAASAIAAAKDWLFGGNTIVRVGLIILFVGLSFLASYAASAGLFPIELRLSLVVAIGIALLAVGFRTRTARPGFGLALQGAGIATIYLTLFAAAKLYDTFPVTAAFALMVVVCALGCALALLQRAQALAATAFAGGFAVPLLLAGDGGSIVIVFAYYTILNLAILFIAQRQAWRTLNLIGFFATFGVATLWGMSAYQPGDYAAAQFFLIVSVLIYVITAVLYARATPGTLGNVVDTTLLFGPAIAGFGLQVGLVHDRPFGSAFAALGFAALYLGIAGWTMRYRRDGWRTMNEAMLAIGIGFVTLAVPLALGARWTSAAWALEGAGAFWVGMRQARWMPRLFGLLLQGLAALIVVGSWSNLSAVPIINPAFIGAMLIALAALATAWWLREPLPHSGSRLANAYAGIETGLAAPAFLFGFAFWCAAWAGEVTRSIPPLRAGEPPLPVFDPGLQPLLLLLVFMLSAAAAQWIARRCRWPIAQWPSYVTLSALALAFFSQITLGRHVLQTPDWALWIAAIALHLRLLYVNDVQDGAPEWRPIRAGIHIGGVWLGAAILADCLWFGIDRARLWQTSWAQIVFLAATLAVLAVLTRAGKMLKPGAPAARWPLDRHAAAYAWYAAIPIAALTYVGALFTALRSSGTADPLPYIPLLNPVDLTLGLSLATLELWRRTILAAEPAPRGATALGGTGAFAALAALAFVMVNTVWLRIAHHLLNVPWEGDVLLASVVVQTGIAILWTSLALALMVLAYRRGQRTVWLIGAGLLALTVVKLLLIDLNNAGGGARIIAFIVVGLLMLVVGYLAPLPPKTADPIDHGASA